MREARIVSDVEMVEIQQVNEAFERLANDDVTHRFVIDMASFNRA